MHTLSVMFNTNAFRQGSSEHRSINRQAAGAWYSRLGLRQLTPGSSNAHRQILPARQDDDKTNRLLEAKRGSAW